MENILGMLGIESLTNLIPMAIGWILAIGVIWKVLSKILILIKEVGELLIAIAESLQDKKLTAEEMAVLKKELQDVINASKGIFKK